MCRRRDSISKIIVKIVFASFLIVTIAYFNSFVEAADDKEQSNRPKIGLVLGGGGARGAAHIGVLKLLQENRVPIDYVVGTSMGSIVGGLYASGMSTQEIEETFKAIDWSDIFTDRPQDKDLSFRHKQDRKQLIDFEMGFNKGKLTLPKGFIAGQKLGFLLKSLTLQTVGLSNFDQLPIPFRAVATDIETGEMVLLDRGDLALAMRASMSVPAVFSPVEIDGRLLVDGGIVKNLPIDIARQMGADIIIAVDVGSALLSREELKSVLDITMQVIGIVTLRNVKEEIAKLKEEDLLISPDLGDISTADFQRIPEIIVLGEETARKFVSQLQRYSVSSDEYRVFHTRQQRDILESTIIDYVKVKELARVAPDVIKGKIKTKPGEELNLETLKGDLTRVYASGDFERVDFKLIKERDKTGLLIKAEEKSWGPNYLRFGLNITDDFEGDGYYNLVIDYTATQLNRFGAEWKNELQVGRTYRFLSEFYQPLDYLDRFFICPKFEYERDITDVYSGDARTSQYSVRSFVGGLDLGANLGTFAQARLGMLRGKIKAGRFVGEDTLPEFNIDQAALTASFVFDQFDDWNFPRRGFYFGSDIFMARKNLGADESYDKLSLSLMKATTFDKHTFLTDLYAGTNLGRDIPFYDEFTLGGFLSLSGYRKGQLRGQYIGLGRVIYYYRVTEISTGWAEAIYLGGSLEFGNVWDRRGDIDLGDLLVGGSFFIGFDTIFGPLYLGCGIAEDSSDAKFYLFLGQTF